MSTPIHDRTPDTPAGAAPLIPAQDESFEPRPTRDDRRGEIVDRLLDALEDLVVRHRALARTGAQGDLHAELIAAEVAHELSVTRAALRRHPPLRRTG